MNQESYEISHDLPENTPQDYVGHRQRLKERFLKGGPDALADYEMLELVLFLGIPRGDVKPLAKQLMRIYGSFAEIISVPIEKLLNHKGIGTHAVFAIKIIGAAAIRLAREQIINKPILSSWRLVLDYCHASLAFAEKEEFHVLYLDNKNRLITDETHQKGTIDQASVYPRDIIKRCLELNALSIVLVHNHPSGDPSPSKADIEITKEINQIAKLLGISIHDHLIIGKNGHASFKSLGLL